MQDTINEADLFAGLDFPIVDNRTNKHEYIEQVINEVLSNPHRGQEARELPDKWKCFTEQEVRSIISEILYRL